MKQLHLLAIELIDMGWIQVIEDKNVSYKIGTINGWFYYNPAEERYVWYHCTKIENGYNHVHLNIQTKDELKTCLKVFDAKMKIEPRKHKNAHVDNEISVSRQVIDEVIRAEKRDSVQRQIEEQIYIAKEKLATIGLKCILDSSLDDEERLNLLIDYNERSRGV